MNGDENIKPVLRLKCTRREAACTHTAAVFRIDRIFVFGVLLCPIPVCVLIQFLSYCNS